jgi:hypothetical protein
MMEYTEAQYKIALQVVSSYEAMLKEKAKTLESAITEALTEYFKTNRLDGHSIVNDFTVTSDRLGRNFEIQIYNPFIDEDYGGGNDRGVEKIGKEFGINLFFDSGMYGK